MDTSTDRVDIRIGLALSGGGSRAAAFHLGCLRALDDLDLLPQVRVISGVSGGALLGAAWAYGDRDFATFDERITDFLRQGLQRSLLWRLLKPSALGRQLVSSPQRGRAGDPPAARVRRWSRTEALARLLDDTLFPDADLLSPTHPGLSVVLTSTDLTTGAAVRFGSDANSCSRYGRVQESVSIGTAVAASAAYPLLLPALERQFTFKRANATRTESVMLGDGGIYDNLGLSVLTPRRSPQFTDHVYNVTHIVSCDAGRGLLAPRVSRFFLRRIARSFEIVHAQAQNQGRGRLHEWSAAGQIDGFVMAYLGQRDDRLPVPINDLVPHADVASYPTNFAAMNEEDIDALTTRGEQLIRALLPHYCSALSGHSRS